MKKKKKEKFVDDGRVIAKMNVDGMPWHLDIKDQGNTSNIEQEKEPLTGKEKRAMMWGVMQAAMLIAGIFLLVFGGFIAFCVFVWFK